MSALYTPQMLALSAQLARHPWGDGFAHEAQARSTVCGSTIAIGIDLDKSQRVSRVGMKVSACAVGQSSAAILAGSATGKGFSDISAALIGLQGWLSGEGDLPDWPGLDAISGAREYPGRHGALLLPWEAAIKALSSTQ